MVTEGLRGRDFLRLQDFSKTELETMLDVGFATEGRQHHAPRPRRHPAAPHAVHDVLQPQPAHAQQLRSGYLPAGRSCPLPGTVGDAPAYLEGEDLGYASERISDVARVLSRMGDCIAIRILGDVVGWEYDKSYRIIEEFAKWSHVPVINMEDNKYHPCQGMADAMALWELFGKDLRGRKIAVTWTYGSSPKKPIAPHHDFMYMASLFGADVVFARPPEMRIDPDIEADIKANVEASGGSYSWWRTWKTPARTPTSSMPRITSALDLLPPVTAQPEKDEMISYSASTRAGSPTRNA
jgi:N-acetylornithine carbamoyltransferase